MRTHAVLNTLLNDVTPTMHKVRYASLYTVLISSTS